MSATGLFPAPALRPPQMRGAQPVHSDGPRVVSASPFRLPGSRINGADVEIEHAGLRFRVLVRGGHVVYPFLLGESAVHIGEEALRSRVEAAALEAAGGLAE